MPILSILLSLRLSRQLRLFQGETVPCGLGTGGEAPRTRAVQASLRAAEEMATAASTR